MRYRLFKELPIDTANDIINLTSKWKRYESLWAKNIGDRDICRQMLVTDDFLALDRITVWTEKYGDRGFVKSLIDKNNVHSVGVWNNYNYEFGHVIWITKKPLSVESYTMIFEKHGKYLCFTLGNDSESNIINLVRVYISEDDLKHSGYKNIHEVVGKLLDERELIAGKFTVSLMY